MDAKKIKKIKKMTRQDLIKRYLDLNKRHDDLIESYVNFLDLSTELIEENRLLKRKIDMFKFKNNLQKHF